ncbi:biotin carboxyl carrier protein of acetyl-CoA carboxylase 1, chloroplastic-like [Typha angustifolia]|uniref:biotin carboxyl carrier protein of acetyl-CoA carboxylase 1, chloroplastic-like n=1 Tax=Typha angustifolia TaxID=59011 RepID=UPI003C2FE731
MASITIPCPKCSFAARGRSSRRDALQQQPSSIVPVSKVGSSWIAGSGSFSLSHGRDERQFPVLKAQVQEVSIEGSSNSLPTASAKEDTLSLSKKKDSDIADASSSQAPVPESAISAFLAEASQLVMLVDSKDVTELQLKYNDCELIIRKKEALPQPVPPVHPMMMQQPQVMFQSPTPMPQSAPPAPSSPAAAAPAPALALPPPAKGGSKSSLPPLKCPMAGTFYRSPAPGEPAFVKVGDKVQKGQVVCIIEAMKLMNEIEADQSGTVVEIVAEDGKPVSVDTPLLIIQP